MNSIVDPNLAIKEQFVTRVIVTADGQTTALRNFTVAAAPVAGTGTLVWAGSKLSGDLTLDRLAVDTGDRRVDGDAGEPEDGAATGGFRHQLDPIDTAQ